MAGIEGDATCPKEHCRAPIVWRLTVNNRRISLDVDPHPDGNVIVVEQDGRIRARILTGVEMPAQEDAYRQHQCPKPEPVGPACTVCWLPMPRDPAYREHWWCHPCCDPEYNRELAEQGLSRKGIAA